MKKLLLLLFAAGYCNGVLYAQVAPVKNEGSTKEVVAKLQSLSTDRIIEKAYLHFDKPYYSPGDTIYFKAYVTAGERHELSKISGVLHVDLVSKNDSIMQTVVLQLKNGLAWGDIALPGYMAKGNYRVRAYTQWMQNAGNAYVFYKTIPVNGKSIAPITAKAEDAKADIQFFPEGGTFVAALPGRIAFKAVGSNGMGVYVKGIVVDNNNVAVAKFTSAHLGMGQIFLTPEEGKTYKAKVTFPDGSVNMIDLPKPEAKGMSLTVNNSDLNKLSIDINANKTYYLENKNKEVNVVVYSAGVVKTVKTVLDNQVIGFDLPKKDLASGITQITLFSGNGVPLSERLVFIQNPADVNFTINSDKITYASHDKAQITLNAKQLGDKVSIGNFSVAVVDENKVQTNEDKESSILSDLLLTSELRGYVEQPGYYFNNVNADTRNNLDILMLTQGYRRFEWKQLLNDSPAPLAYKSEVGMDVKGTLVTNAGSPIPNEKVSLMLASTMQSINAVTDANGRFSFPDLEFADKTKFLLNIENKSLRNKAKFVLDKTTQDLPVTATNLPEGKMEVKLPDYNGTTTDVSNFVQNKTAPLKVVNARERVKYRSSSMAGAGNADQVIFRKDILAAPSLTQGLVGIARNIDFVNGRAYIRNNAVLASVAGGKQEPMLIVVDGAVTQNGNIDNYLPGDIDNIEILRGANASAYGLGAGAGVIVINTRQGGTDDGVVSKETSPGILSINPKGFYVAREFYSPVYRATQKWPAEDRATIFWKPNLITNEAGNATFDYFNDGPGQYRIIVEGIDSAGNIGHAVYKYTVK